MHIAFLTPEYPHPKVTASGGLGTSIKNLATALAKENVQVSLFIYGQSEDVIFTESGIKFHLIKHQKFKVLGWYLKRKAIQKYINTYIKLENIDVVEAPDWTGISAFMNLKSPLVIRFNGSDGYFCKIDGRKQKPKHRFLEKIALKHANHLVSVSKYTADETRKIFNLNKEIKVIPNSINADNFEPQSEVLQHLSVLYFGTLIRKKGVLEIPFYLNKVSKSIPNCNFIFAGRDVVDKQTGRSTKNLMQNILSQDVKKNVQFLGALPYAKIKTEIAKASVVILPSYAEALPMTWIEAMAMEKAIVTSDIGWAKEVMIDGETGFTVNPKNHKQFAEHIMTLLSDASLRETLGKQARKQVLTKFDTKVVTPQNIAFYKSISN